MIKTKRPSPTGFTFIELLVVVTIMIMLSAVAVTSYLSANRNARNGKRKTDLETVRQSLVLYRTDNTGYPDTNTFSTMVTTISDYLGATTFTDPRNEAPYVYSYTTLDNGVTFELCAYLEPDPGTEYCVTNP